MMCVHGSLNTGRCCDEGKSYIKEVPDSPATIAYKAIIDSKLCLLP